MIKPSFSFLSYSGHGMIEKYPRGTSFIYVTGHERRHRIKNQLMALATGKKVSQRTSYKLTISKGRLIAQEGVTKSVMRNRENRTDSPKTGFLSVRDKPVVRRDFVKLRGQQSTIVDSYGFMKRNVPGVELNGGVGSAIKAKSALKDLAGRQPETFMHIRFKFRSDYQGVKKEELDLLEKKLNSLNKSAALLSEKESFNVQKSRSSKQNIVEFGTTFDSPDGDYSVKVNRIASGEQTVSNELSDPYAALGYSGSFNINGYTVSVSSTDSANDIKNKINYGEDVNKNGKLDYAEDINGNGQADSIVIKGVMTPEGFLNSYSYFEDVDSSRSLEESEDLNDNKLMDGGSEQIKIVASIERNRLVFRNQSSNIVRLTDDDGILQGLGFFVEDSKGFPIRNDRQLLSNGENLNIPLRKAALEVDDKTYERNTNKISDIIKDTTISIKKVSDSNVEVTIESDFSVVKNLIDTFIEDYNNVISFINEQSISDGLLSENSRIQDLRSNLVRDVSEPTGDNGADFRNIGLKKFAGGHGLNQISLANLKRLLNEKPDLPSLPTIGQGSMLGRLEKIGIENRQNDTLTVDSKKLFSSLKEGIEEARNILSGENSISERVIEETDKALDSKIGTLKFQRDVADIYSKNQSLADDLKPSLSQNNTEQDLTDFL